MQGSQQQDSTCNTKISGFFEPSLESLQYEHDIVDGKLNSTKIYHTNGHLCNELFLENGFVKTSKVYNIEGKIILSLDLAEKNGKCKAEEYDSAGKLVYTGDYYKNQRSGYGVLYNNMGNQIYEGNWLHGKPHDEGIEFWDTGIQYYVGHFCNGIKEGHGICYHSNGNINYKGDWKQDKYYGWGTKYDIEGIINYEGYFLNGDTHYKGAKYNEHGRVQYKGEHLNNAANGYGEIYWDNGNIKYKGWWKNDSFTGEGTLFYSNETIHYHGGFENDKFNGQGKKYDYSGKLIVNAFWDDNVIKSLCLDEEAFASGQNKQDYLATDLSYIGELNLKNQPDGFGLSIKRSIGQKSYEGYWKEGKPHGSGKEYWVTGKDTKLLYCGTIEESKASGFGVNYHFNGKVDYLGLFNNNERDRGKFFLEFSKTGEITNIYNTN